MKWIFIWLMPVFVFAHSLSLEILGSGGPEIGSRASSSYLIWIDHKARILIDTGGGSFLRFGQSSAKIEDLQLIALTHLHIDHSVDLPAFMKAGYFSQRVRALPIIGTVGSGDFPDINTFLNRLFGTQGAYAYMKDILTPQSDSFMLQAIQVSQAMQTKDFGDFSITSVGVHHGNVPALAFAIMIDGKKIVFSGDTNAQSKALIKLSQNADYLIAHHAIPQDAGIYAKALHMTPAHIGEIAKSAKIQHLILSHRMKRTLGKEKQSLREIRRYYKGDVIWAEDRMKITVK